MQVGSAEARDSLRSWLQPFSSNCVDMLAAEELSKLRVPEKGLRTSGTLNDPWPSLHRAHWPRPLSMAWMNNHKKASSGRSLKIEAVTNTWNFKDWMGQVGLHVEGLTSTHVQPYANHVWRFESRLFVTEQDIECHHPDWQGLEQHHEDVILRVKQFISSPNWSQKPQL